MRNQLFISYSHNDKKWLEQLKVRLKPLERAGTVVRWDDTNIRPGQKWQSEIEQALTATQVAVLLVSPDFLASDFIANDELPKLLAAAETQGTTILSIIISPCVLPPSISKFQAINAPDKTLIEMKKSERERTWVKAIQSIEAAMTAGAAPSSAQRNPTGAAEGAAQHTPPAARQGNEPSTAQGIIFGKDLKLDGSRVGDIALSKGEDLAKLVQPEGPIDFLTGAELKNTEAGDIVLLKQERKDKT